MAEGFNGRSLISWEDGGILVGGLLGALGLFGIVGPAGIGLAIVAAVTTRVTSAPFGVGVLHLSALLSGDFPEILPLVVLESSAIVFILAEQKHFDELLLTVAFVSGAVVFAVPTVFFAKSNGVLAAVSVLILSMSILSYGLHRYERVRLGLVTEGSA